MKTFSAIFLLLILLIACEPQPKVESRISKTNISIPASFEIIEFSHDWAIGETVEEYTLRISEKDYKRIIEEIKNKPYFEYLDSTEVPESLFNSDADFSKTYEKAYCFEGKYFYEIFMPKPVVSTTTIVLKRDSIMNVLYNDL